MRTLDGAGGSLTNKGIWDNLSQPYAPLFCHLHFIINVSDPLSHVLYLYISDLLLHTKLCPLLSLKKTILVAAGYENSKTPLFIYLFLFGRKIENVGWPLAYYPMAPWWLNSFHRKLHPVPRPRMPAPLKWRHHESLHKRFNLMFNLNCLNWFPVLDSLIWTANCRELTTVTPTIAPRDPFVMVKQAKCLFRQFAEGPQMNTGIFLFPNYNVNSEVSRPTLISWTNISKMCPVILPRN